VKQHHKIITLLSAVPYSPWKSWKIMAFFTVLHQQIRVRTVGTPDLYLRDAGFELGHKQAILRVLCVVMLSQSSDFEGH
jgi:hypothetical protein